MREGDKKKNHAKCRERTPHTSFTDVSHCPMGVLSHRAITLCRLLPFLGPAHCAEPGMPPASGRDNYVADAGPSVGRHKQMLWLT